jgi:hypothetical protein
VPDTVPRAEPDTSLQITAPTGWLVTLLMSLFVSFNDMLNFVIVLGAHNVRASSLANAKGASEDNRMLLDCL